MLSRCLSSSCLGLPALAAWLMLVASCAAGDQQRAETPLVAVTGPVRTADSQPVAAQQGPNSFRQHLETKVELPTAATDLDGSIRMAEPPARQDRRSTEAQLHPLVMPLQAASEGRGTYPRIASQSHGSIAIGTVTTGFLVDGASFEPEGPTHKILEKIVDRQTRFTTDEMKALLLCAAQHVQKKFPGHKLHLGNMARQGGGALPWSVSHHNGRDVDIGFYARTLTGAYADPDFLYHFNANLRTTDALEPMQFDVPANWELAKALVTCPGPEIQYLFIANWLKVPIVEYAVKQKEKKDVIAKVAAILHQPNGALPHNDHLHLRIACSRDDATEGCLDASRAPAEALGRVPAVRERIPAIRAALVNKDSALRAGAVTLLAQYRDSESLPQLFACLQDSALPVRQAAVSALDGWRPAGLAEPLRRALAQEVDAATASQSLRLLAAIEPAQLLELLKDFRELHSADLEVSRLVIRQLAAELLSESTSLAVVPALADLLADADSGVRDSARNALARIVNRTTGDLLASLNLPADMPTPPQQERDLWRNFCAGLQPDAQRDAVALQSLRDHGVAIASLDRSQLPELLRALALPAPYSDNAARWLERVLAWKYVPGKGARATPLAFWAQFVAQKRIVSPAVLASVLPAGLVPGAMSGPAPAPGTAVDAD